MKEGCGIFIIIILAVFGWFSISHIGAPNSGQHTGYVTAVEQEGWIWKTWRAYVKTDPQSSQEDEYCVKDPAVVTKLQDLQKTREIITIEYSAPFILFNWECGGENSIINAVSN